MIKAVIFDCFGVLTGDLWKEFLATLPPEQVEPARDLNHALDRGFIDLSEFSQKVHELTGILPKRVEDIIGADMEKNQALLDYIAELGKTHKIGLLSNVSSDWVHTEFLNSDEVALFNDMLLSYQTGMIKPDPELYKLAAQRLSCEVQECIMVDDGIANCKGAEAVGMKAILYTNFVQFKTEVEALLADSN